MYKVKRTIYVDNQSIDVWFGLVSKTKNGKNGKYTVYLLTDDPNNPYNHAEPILSNIKRNSRPKSNRIYQRAVS